MGHRTMKIEYTRADGTNSTAYVAEDPDEQGVHLGTDKHTQQVARVMFDPKTERWEQVVYTRTDPHGNKWLYGGESTDDHLALGGHETAIVNIARSLLPEGGVFLDVGAHVGLYTVRLADKASEVYAIEANHKTWETLCTNVRLNDLENVAAHNVAAWDKVARLDMTDENGKDTGGSTHCHEISKDRPQRNITQGVPIDQMGLGLKSLDLVKIDVEGAEARVLIGASKTLQKFKPVLLIEMHDKVYDLPGLRKEVETFLASNGYTDVDSTLTHGPECYYFIAKHRDYKEPDLGFQIETVRSGDNGHD